MNECSIVYTKMLRFPKWWCECTVPMYGYRTIINVVCIERGMEPSINIRTGQSKQQRYFPKKKKTEYFMFQSAPIRIYMIYLLSPCSIFYDFIIYIFLCKYVSSNQIYNVRTSTYIRYYHILNDDDASNVHRMFAYRMLLHFTICHFHVWC